MATFAGDSSELAEAERRHAEQVQSALYRIAELASAAQDMQEFYRAMHGVVGELMHASNFYIALYDEERQLINLPYYADELDDDGPNRTSGSSSAAARRAGRRGTCCAPASRN